MKRMSHWFAFTVVCVLCTVLLAGCGVKSDTENTDDFIRLPVRYSYSINNFDSITIGKSTSKDVYKIAPSAVMYETSSGGYVEYPTYMGGVIRIEFNRPDFIVEAIEEIYTGPYYSIEDFESIIIGESTSKDVDDIAPSAAMLATSYGGLCEYPTRTGGVICIKFIGSDFIVDSIEEEYTGDYYSIEDFESIKIGESTSKDVCNIVPSKVISMQATNYGGICEFPTRTGGIIRIEFHGSELIVGKLEEISPSVD